MLTFYNLYQTYKTITKDDTAANVTLGKLLINDTQKNICGSGSFTFLNDVWYNPSITNQGTYRLPHNYRPSGLVSLYVINGTTKYIPIEEPSVENFDRLSSVVSYSSYPERFNIFGDYISYYPYPSDTNWEIYLKYKKQALEMSADDYTTGTISITQNTSLVTGSGTTFTSLMVGRFLKCPDGLWYEIAAYNSAISLTLAKTYEGVTFTGSTYTIGEIPIIPDGFQLMLIYPALEHYFMIKGEESRSIFYKNLYDADLRNLKSQFLSDSTQQVIRKSTDFKNPNDYPLNLHE